MPLRSVHRRADGAVPALLRSVPRRAGVALLVVALAGAACGGETLDFADWINPVPEGTTVLSYASVPLAARSQTIDVVEDLVIGERDDDDNYTFYNARGPRVADDGTIWVLDGGNFRVQVFDDDGEYLASYGAQGQGPGEFTRPSAVILTGDRMSVWDFGNRRVGVWSLAGEHYGEIPYPTGPSPSGWIGFRNGETLARVRIRDEDADGFAAAQSPSYELVTYGAELERVRSLHASPPSPVPSIVRSTATSGSFSAMRVPTARPSFAATRDGDVYTTMAAEYQLRAYDGTTGDLRWGLRVAWPRVPIEEVEILAALEQARERMPDASRSEVGWPDARPAINYIAVDGHGHLYVYPFPGDQDEAESRVVPVDVFSPAGEHLFSGLIEALRWSDARGDFVYTNDSDDVSGAERVIRYRLVEPF